MTRLTYDEALKLAHDHFHNPVNLTGRCHDYCRFISDYIGYKIVGGYYIDNKGFKNPHYWLEDEAGTIYDPTESQFGCVGEGKWSKHSR
jgi:hypothetical protein